MTLEQQFGDEQPNRHQLGHQMVAIFSSEYHSFYSNKQDSETFLFRVMPYQLTLKSQDHFAVPGLTLTLNAFHDLGHLTLEMTDKILTSLSEYQAD